MSAEKPGPQRANDEPSLENSSERTSRGQEYDGYVTKQSGRLDPDVVLDVPMLKVDEIDLEVEDLKAQVSLRAELADFVKVNVGVEVNLGKVKLEIKGVEAQALLKVKLEGILNTIDRALDSIDRNPQILGGAVRSIDWAEEHESRTTRDTDQGAEQLAQLPGGIVDQTEETTEPADLAPTWTVEGDDQATGNLLDETVDGADRTADDWQAWEEDAEKVNATDAAKRKARKLGVWLSEVKGTGSGGRVLVKDVEKAAT